MWLIPPGPFLLLNLQEEKCIQMMSNVGINHHPDSQPVSMLITSEYLRHLHLVWDCRNTRAHQEFQVPGPSLPLTD